MAIEREVLYPAVHRAKKERTRSCDLRFKRGEAIYWLELKVACSNTKYSRNEFVSDIEKLTQLPERNGSYQVKKVTDFTVISSKNVELSRMGDYERVSTRTKGEGSIHIISLIPTGLYPDAKNAMDNAIEGQPGGMALVDGVITRKWFYIPFIYGRDCYEVEGNVLVDSQRQ